MQHVQRRVYCIQMARIERFNKHTTGQGIDAYSEAIFHQIYK